MKNIIAEHTPIFTISADSLDALNQLALEYYAAIDSLDEPELSRLCFTVCTGRHHFGHRFSCVASSKRKVLDALTEFLTSAKDESQKIRVNKPVAFMCGDSREQYAGITETLTSEFSVFESIRGKFEEALFNALDLRVADILNEPSLHVNKYNFLLQIGTAQIWSDFGIEPEFYIAHQNGLLSALYLSGALDLDSVIKVLTHLDETRCDKEQRGLQVRLSQSDMEALKETLENNIQIEPINADLVEVTASEVGLKELAILLKESGIGFDEISAASINGQDENFSKLEAELIINDPIKPILNLVTGEYINGASDFEWHHVASSEVNLNQFGDNLNKVGAHILIELGRGDNLSNRISPIIGTDKHKFLSTFKIEKISKTTIYNCLVQLHQLGGGIDWAAFYSYQNLEKLPLPTYSFNGENYWPDSLNSSESLVKFTSNHPLEKTVDTATGEKIYSTEFGYRHPYILEDHKLHNTVIAPGASHVAMLINITRELEHQAPVAIENITFYQAMVYEHEHLRAVQYILSGGSNTYDVLAYSRETESDDWTKNMSSVVKVDINLTEDDIRLPVELKRFKQQTIGQFSGQEFYQFLAKAGYHLGDNFQWITDVWKGDNEAACTMRLAFNSQEKGDYVIQPGLMDACFQTAALATLSQQDFDNKQPDMYIPFAVDKLYLVGKEVNTELTVFVKNRDKTTEFNEVIVYDVWVYEADGSLFMKIAGLRCKRAPKEILLNSNQQELVTSTYENTWPQKPLEMQESVLFSPNVAVISDPDERLNALVCAFEEESIRSTQLIRGNIFKLDAGHLTLNTRVGGELLHASEHLVGATPNIETLFIMAPTLDTDSIEEISEFKLKQFSEELVAIYQNLISTLPSVKTVYICTSGYKDTNSSVKSMLVSSWWAIGKVLSSESPHLKVRIIDIPERTQSSQFADILLDEYMYSDGEPQVIYQGGRRKVARLSAHSFNKFAFQDLNATDDAYQVTLLQKGSFDYLTFSPLNTQDLDPYDIEVDIFCTGMNFRDVLGALDLYPGDPGPLGGECSGVIKRVGQKVSHFKVGDSVVAMVQGSLSSSVVVNENQAVLKPRSISHQQAVALPVTYATVLHSLKTLAELKEGERVLIHAAAGGVGLAAITYAQFVKAEVFVTVGNQEKVDFMEKLGVRNIYNSRSSEFKEAILHDTQGQGVDVVLNSLPNELMHASVEVLSEKGRFIEIGKIGILSNEQFKALKPLAHFYHFDLAEMAKTEVDYVRGWMEYALKSVDEGLLEALPLTAFNIDNVKDAFRFMSQGKHIGKVVIDHAKKEKAIKDSGTYIITGGLGGLGLAIAKWLVESNASNIVLVGRSKPDDAKLKTIQSLTSDQSKVTFKQCDISISDEVDALFNDLQQVNGIFHAAGVVDDESLSKLTLPQLSKVLAPKVQGTWHLHKYSDHLDLFVLFSSISPLIGVPGQANYAIANEFLDEFAYYRQSIGLPASVINWGPWKDIGMAAQKNVSENLERVSAFKGIETEAGIDILERIISERLNQATVMPLAKSAHALLSHGDIPNHLLKDLDLHQGEKNVLGDATSLSSGVITRLKEEVLNTDASGREEKLVDIITDQLVSIMKLDSGDQVSPEQPLIELGLDSLIAIELRNILSKITGIDLPASVLFDYPTIQQLSRYIAIELQDK